MQPVNCTPTSIRCHWPSTGAVRKTQRYRRNYKPSSPNIPRSNWRRSVRSISRLTNCLCNDSYQIAGRAAFKDEFVTCGGISLAAVDTNTLESKHLPRVFFAGEVLDIDGVTGGFNFQAAWTTAYVVAQAIARQED